MRALIFLIVTMSMGLGAVSVQAQIRPEDRTMFRCLANASTATTLTALGGECAAPGAGRAFYITDITVGSSVVSGTAADSGPTIKYGTGGSCGTGTVTLWSTSIIANDTRTVQFSVPLKAARNNELCWMDTPAGTKWITVTGYIAK